MVNCLQIFPNPCDDFVYIKSIEPGPFKVQLITVLGEYIFNGYAENNTLEVKGLPQGVYIIKINGSIYRLVKK